MSCRHWWRADAVTLGRIGLALSRQALPDIDVRLPRDLAQAAIDAWNRDDDETEGPIRETWERRMYRQRAAALALIGLAIAERGVWDGDEVLVTLAPAFVGNAADAADDLPAG